MAVTTALVVGTVASAAISANAASKGAKASERATQSTVGEQARQYDQTREDFAPFRGLGNAAISDINRLYGRGPDGSTTGKPDMGVFFESPDYQFNLAQGQKAIDNSLAARGRALSGAGVKAGARYAQGLASTEFGNFYNRLASQAGLGQAAAGSTAAAGANAANNIGNAYLANAQNKSSAYAMGAQGLNQSIQGGLSNYLLMRYLNPSSPPG